jgi:hypothetical protein
MEAMLTLQRVEEERQRKIAAAQKAGLAITAAVSAFVLFLFILV